MCCGLLVGDELPAVYNALGLLREAGTGGGNLRAYGKYDGMREGLSRAVDSGLYHFEM